jgi:hypothetical protein
MKSISGRIAYKISICIEIDAKEESFFDNHIRHWVNYDAFIDHFINKFFENCLSFFFARADLKQFSMGVILPGENT